MRVERQRQRLTRSASQLAVANYKSGSTLFGARYKANPLDLEGLDLLPSFPPASTTIRQTVPSAQSSSQTATMSHFIGPNMYLIESSIQEGLYLNLDGGNKADGTKVLTK